MPFAPRIALRVWHVREHPAVLAEDSFDALHPLEHLKAGMYELNEKSFADAERRHCLENWNVGISSPKMPYPTEQHKH
jgi:hypothetical protein